MPDIIDENGLTVSTAAEITSRLVAGFKAIYGNSINVDSNSPDGQRIGIYTQASVDIRELAVSVNNNFDPDQAQGVILDQRVTINNIKRVGGTYTIQPIDIITNATVNLQGLDAEFNDVNGTGYTIQDSAGNEFILQDSVTLTAGTNTLNFRSKTIGAVDVPINTITTPVTIVIGVVSVNNSSAAITVGQAQEADPQLRTRRQRSPAINSTGYLNGLRAALLDLDGVTEAEVYENNTDSTDIHGTPEHCIWVVVAGGANSDIGNLIYAKKSDGCSMRGAVTFDIITASNSLFVAKWDVPLAEPLYINFTIKRTTPGFVFDETAIKAYMADHLIYNIGAFAETASITAVASAGILSQGGGGVAVLVEISDDNISFTDYLDAATLKSQFTVDPANIDITVV